MNFNAVGIHGQLIHIDRARRLVIVINSAWPVATGRDYSAARSSLLRAIVTAVDADGWEEAVVTGLAHLAPGHQIVRPRELRNLSVGEDRAGDVRPGFRGLRER